MRSAHVLKKKNVEKLKKKGEVKSIKKNEKILCFAVNGFSYNVLVKVDAVFSRVRLINHFSCQRSKFSKI